MNRLHGVKPRPGRIRRAIAAALLLVLLPLSAYAVDASTGSVLFDAFFGVADGAKSTASGGEYTLTGSVLSARDDLTGGQYALTGQVGGMLTAAPAPPATDGPKIYLPIISSAE